MAMMERSGSPVIIKIGTPIPASAADKCGREAHKICESLSPEKIYNDWKNLIKNIIENK